MSWNSDRMTYGKVLAYSAASGAGFTVGSRVMNWLIDNRGKFGAALGLVCGVLYAGGQRLTDRLLDGFQGWAGSTWATVMSHTPLAPLPVPMQVVLVFAVLAVFRVVWKATRQRAGYY